MISIISLDASEHSAIFYCSAGSVKLGTNYYHQLIGPYHLDRTYNRYVDSSVRSTINTPPPATFYTDIWGNTGYHDENNCFHVQVDGNLDFSSMQFNETSRGQLEAFTTSDYGTVYRWVNADGTRLAYPGYTPNIASNGAYTPTQVYNAIRAVGILVNPCYMLGTVEYQHFPNAYFGYDRILRYAAGNYNIYSSRIADPPYLWLTGYSNRYYNTSIDAYSADGTLIGHNTQGGDKQLVCLSGTEAVSEVMEETLDSIKLYASQKLMSMSNNAYDICKQYSIYDATRASLENLQPLKSNYLENYQDVFDPMRSLPPIKDLLCIKSSPAKTSAGLYLWYKYSYSPTSSDVSDVLTNFQGIIDGLLSEDVNFIGRGSNYFDSTFLDMPITVEQHARSSLVQHNRTKAEEFNNKLALLGLDVSLEGVWNMVPFSFIFDWFTGFGSLLSDVDYALFAQNRMEVRSITASSRFTIPNIAPHYLTIFERVISNVNMTVYYRRVQPYFPPNEFNFGSTSPTNHIFEGAALVVANW